MPFSKEPSATGMAARTALILFLFVVVFTAILSTIQGLTEPAIRAAAAEEEMRAINETLPRSLYDNDLLQDTLPLPPTPELGQDQPSRIYRARLAGQPSAVILQVVAPDGYSGKIHMLVAVRVDAQHAGEIAGVRVTRHKETPGLGDYVEAKKDRNKSSPWIAQFNELSFAKRPDKDWKVKKDGGQFDAYAGATVTARAVVKAVRKALNWANTHRDQLLADSDRK